MDRYQVAKVVGKGSFGKALLCRSRKDGRLCIIKQVNSTALQHFTLLSQLHEGQVQQACKVRLHGMLLKRYRGMLLCLSAKQVDTAKLGPRERREAHKEAALLATMRHPNIVGEFSSHSLPYACKV
jgi:serine/threonine protein kinase